MQKTQAIVIGLGPCGIQSAIQMKRLGIDVIVIGRDFGALLKAEKIENYYGIDSISGSDLVLNGIKQAQNLGITIIRDNVNEIEMTENGYKVICEKGQYECEAVMLATGKSRNKLSLAKDFEGKGVSYCANCDGFFYRKKHIALIGNTSFMKHEFDFLVNVVGSITIFTNGKELEVEIPTGVEVIKGKITKFVGTERLEKIITTDGEFSVDGAFIAEGFQSGFSFANHLGLELSNDSIVVDDNQKTNIPGIFAGGDTTGGIMQIGKSVGDGLKAGNAIYKYIKDKMK